MSDASVSATSPSPSPPLELALTCPQCGRVGTVPASYAGRRLKCGCGAAFNVPVPLPSAPHPASAPASHETNTPEVPPYAAPQASAAEEPSGDPEPTPAAAGDWSALRGILADAEAIRKRTDVMTALWRWYVARKTRPRQDGYVVVGTANFWGAVGIALLFYYLFYGIFLMCFWCMIPVWYVGYWLYFGYWYVAIRASRDARVPLGQKLMVWGCFGVILLLAGIGALLDAISGAR